VRVCLGGTFETLHAGHEALLGAAFALGDEVFIGVTAGAIARRGRKSVSAYATRKKRLERFLKSQGWTDYVIGQIKDEYGPAATDETIRAITVSAEREGVARRLNAERITNDLMPLQVHVVPMVLAEDDCPISSTRIKAKEIDADGKMLRAIRMHVGSENPVKVRAVRNVVRGRYRQVQVSGVAVESGVPAQPKAMETVAGAVNRARAAIGDADFGCGIEAGLFWSEAAGTHLDVQYCAVVDKMERVTIGHGPGFAYPDRVINDVQLGKTVEEAMRRLTGQKDIGQKQGAIGYLTKGKLDRTELTEMAVIAALVPRIRKGLYAMPL
jgi:inosine/xanthosine triphosphatase